MQRTKHKSVKERKAAEGRVYRNALLISLLVHLLLAFGWERDPVPISPFSAAGPRAGDDRAAAGGMQALNLAIPRPRPIVPPRVPIITLDHVEPVVVSLEPEVDLAALIGDGPGLDEGPGIEGGTGEGDGGTGDTGRFTVIPPSPRGMIIPPTNRSLRGSSVQVWVFVSAAGRVVPDSTHLSPPTRDRGFNRRLIEEAAEWVFNPATREGQPVPPLPHPGS
jgi:hypothetical protein